MVHKAMWAHCNHGKPDRWKAALLSHKMTLIIQIYGIDSGDQS